METAESSNRGRKEREEVKVKLKTLKAVMEQCQRALESLNTDGLPDDADNSDDNEDDDEDDSKVADERDNCARSSPSSSPDYEAEELCGLIKSRLEGPEFLERIESAQLSVQQKFPGEEGNSWDMVSDNDLWEGGSAEDDQEDFVVVRQEDIVDGIACFMAAYLLSLKQTKDLSPNKLQDALSKTFSIKKRKGEATKSIGWK